MKGLTNELLYSHPLAIGIFRSGNQKEVFEAYLQGRYIMDVAIETIDRDIFRGIFSNVVNFRLNPVKPRQRIRSFTYRRSACFLLESIKPDRH